MIDFRLASSTQILLQIGERLRQQRVAAVLTQEQLAARAGIALSAVKKLESGGNATLQTFVKVVQALSLTEDLSELFVLKAHLSIADLERAHKAQRKRVRAPRKP